MSGPWEHLAGSAWVIVGSPRLGFQPWPITWNVYSISTGTNRAAGVVGRRIPRRDVGREPITSVGETVKDVEI